MAAVSSTRAIVLEERERTKESSKADIEQFIEESESRIISLESQISALVELRDRERACVAVLRYLIAPIHTLPVELLAEIFDLAIHDDSHVKDTFRISQPHYHGANDRIPDEFLSTAPRWSSLQLLVEHDTPLYFAKQLAESRLDNLEELDMGFRDYNFDSPTTVLSLTTAPRLRKFTINIYSNALPSILVPWSQLTDLNLNSFSPEITLDILVRCTNLIHADIVALEWARFTQVADEIFTLSHLHTLDLYFSKSPGIVLLDHLSVPALQGLCLNFEYVDMASWPQARNWPQARFTAFQLRAPNITQLDLRHSRLTSDDLLSAIRHAPSLTDLKLRSCYSCFDDSLIGVLCYTDAIPLAPHLHTLLLDDIGDNFTEDIFASMIASRWWTDAELASRIVPPTVARWTRVELHTFDSHFLDSLGDLPSDVLVHCC
ncbi:hypothetical protein C8R45DRAFT_1153646 [Mycena sanguinolenta]|nr:hypothetical protein C8R45DRAFT_1153646 [Mycena sanguinolenta]